MSSANKSVKNSVALGRSLMKIKNSKGPRTEPCGTPQIIVFLSDFIPSMQTNYSLSDK